MGKFLSTRKRRMFAGILAAVVMVVGIVGLLWATNVFGWRAWRLQEVEAFIGAPLPEGAMDKQFTTRTSPARIVWLRFAMGPYDTESLDAFVAAMGSPPLKFGFTPFPAPNPQEAEIALWWSPGISDSARGTYWNTGSKIIEIHANRSDSSGFWVCVRAYALGSG